MKLVTFQFSNTKQKRNVTFEIINVNLYRSSAFWLQHEALRANTK